MKAGSHKSRNPTTPDEALKAIRAHFVSEESDRELHRKSKLGPKTRNNPVTEALVAREREAALKLVREMKRSGKLDRMILEAIVSRSAKPQS